MKVFEVIVLVIILCLVIWLIHTVRILKRKIQELAMQVSLLNQENEHMRRKIDRMMKA